MSLSQRPPDILPAEQEAYPEAEETPQQGRSGRWIIGFQVLGSLAILGLVFLALSSPGAVIAALRQADWRWVVLAGGLVALSEILSGVKWWLLLRQSGCPIPLTRIWRLYWIGMFYGTYLPGSVSGDAARVLLTRKEAGLTASAVAVFMQRNTGLAAMLALALAASFIYPVRIGVFHGVLSWLDAPWIWFTGAATGYVAVNLILVSPALAEFTHGMIVRIFPAKVARALDRGLEAAVRGRGLLRSQWRGAAIPMVISVVTQLMDVVVLLLLARALGFVASGPAAYQAMTATSLAGMLPVSINGIGIREVGFGLMLQSGAMAGQAVALGMLTTGLYLACALPGAALHGGALLRKARTSAQPA